MRVLEFDVKRQRLMKNKDCDFTGLIPGTEGYLHAKFNFDDDWTGCKKIVSFWVSDINRLELNEYAVFLGEDDTCAIVPEALLHERFYISIIGTKPDYKITTNKLKIEQEVD